MCGTKLDRPVRCTRDARGQFRSLVDAVDLEQVEAAELLLRLRERSVADDRLAVSDANRRGGAGGGKLRPVDDLAVRRLAECEIPREHPIPVFLRGRLPAGLVAVDQSENLHLSSFIAVHHKTNEAA